MSLHGPKAEKTTGNANIVVTPTNSARFSRPVLPSPNQKRRLNLYRCLFSMGLRSAAGFTVLITFSLIAISVFESGPFFQEVGVIEFFTGTVWTPTFDPPSLGILPLLVGTVMVAGIALLVAIPMGLILSIYLSEFAPVKLRETAKPILELLEGVPTVIYGYFALLVLTPALQTFLPGLKGFNMLAPGLIMGIMILPYVVSLSEDAMRAVPNDLREAGYALGMGRLRVARVAVVPAAMSGILAAFTLGVSRAIGETMVVAIAAGQNPVLSFNPLEGAATITAFIVQISLGDVEHGSIAYRSIFAAGLLLFCMTLLFNLLNHHLRLRFRKQYG